MKICSHCGMKYQDEYLSCPRCGAMDVGGRPFDKPPGMHEMHRQGRPPKMHGMKPPKRNLDFYESTGFIIGSAFFMPPLSLAMLGVRLFRNKKYDDRMRQRRNGSPPKIHRTGSPNGGQSEFYSMPEYGCNGAYQQTSYGENNMQQRKSEDASVSYLKEVLLLLIGVMLFGLFTTYHTLTEQLICVAGGVAMSVWGLLSFRKKFFLNKTGRFYEPFIDKHGNTTIRSIAAKTGKSELKVRTDIQKLLMNGYLSDRAQGISAYLDGKSDTIIMTKNGIPLVPLENPTKENAGKKEQDEKVGKNETKETQPEQKKEEQQPGSEVLSIEERALKEISEAATKIMEAETVKSLESIAQSIRDISALLEEMPEGNDKQSVKDFKTSYLPEMLEWLEKYRKPTTSEGSKMQISGMFHTFSVAFENIEEQLRKADENDTEIDIEVMKKTLEREGLLDSDFKL